MLAVCRPFCSQAFGSLQALAVLGQPSLCTGQLQGLIFTNVLFKKCSCMFRTFMHRARGPRHRYKIAFLGIIQAKGGGQVVVTFLSGGAHRAAPGQAMCLSSLSGALAGTF